MSNQSLRQASVRAVTGTTGTLEEDWLALFDDDGIAAGTFNERLYLWLEDKTGLTGRTIDELKVAFAVLEGVATWNSLGTFDASGSTLALSGTPVLTGTDGVVYTGFTVTATGGTEPYVYSLVGTWPAGISIDSGTGAVSGTPTESGSFASLSVRVTDDDSDTDDLDTFTLVVAIGIPDAPVIDLLAISDRGSSTTDNITNDTEPQFSIDVDSNVQAGDTVHVYDNAVEIGTGIVLTAGQAAGTDPLFLGGDPLADGTHPITMTVENSAGESDPSNEITLVIDTSLGTVAASIAGDSTTDMTPTLTVDISASTLVADGVLNVRSSTGTLLGTHTLTAGEVTADSADVTLSELAIGSHTVTVYGYDASGNFTAEDEYTFAVAAAAFHPDQVPNIALVLDASDLTTLFQTVDGTTTAVAADNDVVGYWGDLSGGSFHLTAAADDTTRPAYNTEDNPHVLFDGTNDALRRLASLGMYAAGECSVFIAYRSASPGTIDILMNEGSSSSGAPNYNLLRTDGTTASTNSVFIRNDAFGNFLSGASETGVYDDSDHVFGIIDSGASIARYLDGSAGGTSGYTRSGTLTVNRFSLGASVTSVIGNWWPGRVYALVIVNRAVDATERANITTWIGAKCGLSL